jgi:TonB family protein
MKTIILGTWLAAIAFCHSFGQAQNDMGFSYESHAEFNEANKPVSATSAKNDNFPPVFRCGMNASLDDFIREIVQYPAVSYQWRHQGTVVIGFMVTSGGGLKDFTVINSVSPESDSEVIRSIKSTEGRWISGSAEGEPADMQQEVAVTFKMNPKSDFMSDAKKYMQKGNQNLFVKNRPKKALACFNQGIKLLPNDMTLLAMRSLCKHRLGDARGAGSDWERLSVLAERYGTNLDWEILGEKVKDSEGLNEYNEFRSNIEKGHFNFNDRMTLGICTGL